MERGLVRYVAAWATVTASEVADGDMKNEELSEYECECECGCGCMWMWMSVSEMYVVVVDVDVEVVGLCMYV